MNPPSIAPPKPTGMRRLGLAFVYSWAGFRAAYRNEASVRQELAALVVLAPLAIALPVSALERVVLIGSVMLVLLVELLNSAIEAIVDRISLERHPLAGQAKDLGSAAVLTSIGISVLCWSVIAGPLAWRLFLGGFPGGLGRS
jgi:diacylglycerol kinase (ATP)